MSEGKPDNLPLLVDIAFELIAPYGELREQPERLTVRTRLRAALIAPLLHATPCSQVFHKAGYRMQARCLPRVEGMLERELWRWRIPRNQVCPAKQHAWVLADRAGSSCFGPARRRSRPSGC